MYIESFEAIDGALVYIGMNQYFIHRDGADFVVDVETLDEYGEAQEGPRYMFSSLSTAIAQIEAIENGEEML